jgi:hypothetical protein
MTILLSTKNYRKIFGCSPLMVSLWGAVEALQARLVDFWDLLSRKMRSYNYQISLGLVELAHREFDLESGVPRCRNGSSLCSPDALVLSFFLSQRRDGTAIPGIQTASRKPNTTLSAKLYERIKTAEPKHDSALPD